MPHKKAIQEQKDLEQKNKTNDAIPILNFLNVLIESCQPLDNDISKLIDNNIMDLLSQ